MRSVKRIGACFVSGSGKCCPRSAPVLEFPGSELPRRQRLDAPLFPPIRRPVTEARFFLDHRCFDASGVASPRLARRLADHIDEFRLVGHGPLLAKRLALMGSACSRYLKDFFPKRLDVEASECPFFV